MTNEQIFSVLVGTGALSVILLISIALTYARPFRAFQAQTREGLFSIILIGVAVHCVHTTEEFATGFYRRFPELLGLQPWPPAFFVAFNLAWIAIWCLAVLGIRASLRIALVPVWFLALASLANGVAHPVLSVVEGGYFPGLWSSPLAGAVGWVLTRRILGSES